MIATPESVHHYEPKQQDRSQVKSALQSALTVRVVCIIEAYLQQWAGFVGLGKEVDGPDPIAAEVADRWLVCSLSEPELRRTAYDWTGSMYRTVFNVASPHQLDSCDLLDLGSLAAMRGASMSRSAPITQTAFHYPGAAVGVEILRIRDAYPLVKGNT